jgi:hypothetical protein
MANPKESRTMPSLRVILAGIVVAFAVAAGGIWATPPADAGITATGAD